METWEPGTIFFIRLRSVNGTTDRWFNLGFFFQRKGTGVQCEATEHYVPPSSSCHAAALHLQK